MNGGLTINGSHLGQEQFETHPLEVLSAESVEQNSIVAGRGRCGRRQIGALHEDMEDQGDHGPRGHHVADNSLTAITSYLLY